MAHEHGPTCGHDHGASSAVDDGHDHEERDQDYGEIPDHDDDGSYALGYEPVPYDAKPLSAASPEPAVRQKKAEPSKTVKEAGAASVDVIKVLPDRAAPRDEMAVFREGCRKAKIEPDKPLYMALAAPYKSSLELKGMIRELKLSIGTAARGLTKEGENDLIQRVTRQVELSMRTAAEKHRLRLSVWTSMAVGLVAVACLTAGAAGGYWWGWAEGRDSVQRVAQEVAVAFSHGKDSAEAGAALLRHNDPARVLAGCVGQAVFISQGRKACTAAIWLEPAPAAAAKSGQQ